MKTYNLIDLFAGVGGLSYGFSINPSFKIIAANEIDKDIAKAYELNHPDAKVFNCDIKDLDKEILLAKIGGVKIDVVVGGPPCQSYSTLGKRKMDDRANLFMEYKRILSILRPKAFIFENVVGILSMDKGNLFKTILKEFKEIGYEVKYKILNSVDYGVPQLRERVFLIGSSGENNFEFPKPTHGEGKKNYITLKDAFADLPKLKSGESSNEYISKPINDFLEFVRKDSESLSEHKAPRNGEHLIKIMETLKDGQGKNDLPEEIRPKSGYGNTYAKLWWDRPSTTITRNFACPSSSRCIHPRDSRAMTIREGARLQGFPDSYLFYGSDGKKRLQIGNAVPPILSIEIANQMLIELEGEDTR